jgi:hypothetical protein
MPPAGGQCGPRRVDLKVVREQQAAVKAKPWTSVEKFRKKIAIATTVLANS